MKKGFTLIELLTVVLIVGILAAIATPQYRKSINRARVAEAQQALPAIYESAERWMLENAQTTTNNLGNFKQLDVELKGRVSPTNSKKWLTDNFEYSFQTQKGGSPTAKIIKTGDKYNGLVVSYDGNEFACCPPSGSAKAGYCTELFGDIKSQC